MYDYNSEIRYENEKSINKKRSRCYETCERIDLIQTKIDWTMTESRWCSSQILQSKTYDVELQRKKLDNVVY